MDVILYTDASPPRLVNARLDSYNRSGHEGALRRTREPGGFVHFQAQSVAETVAEPFPMPATLNVAPSERVGSHAGHSRANRVRRNVIRIAHNSIYLPLLRTRNAYHESSREIRAITLVLRAKVDEKEITTPDLAR